VITRQKVGPRGSGVVGVELIAVPATPVTGASETGDLHLLSVPQISTYAVVSPAGSIHVNVGVWLTTEFPVIGPIRRDSGSAPAS